VRGEDFIVARLHSETRKSTEASVEFNLSNATRQPRSAKKRKFYVVVRKYSRRAGGFKLLNGETLFRDGPPFSFQPPLGRRGFRDYPAEPTFLFDKRLGIADRDFEELSGYWFISDRMKTVLERIDPEAFAFLKCKVQLPDGTDGPLHWLCDVVRVLDALDEEKSRVHIGTADDGSKVYTLFPGRPLIFKDDAVGRHHAFRTMYFDPNVICDEEMRQACKAAGVKGVKFTDSAKH
jgi:hypothetical protein